MDRLDLFVLTLTVKGPAVDRRLTLVKPVIDAVVCGLQAHSDKCTLRAPR